jgi:phosphoribosylglycinamide formyltransferase 1
VSDSPATHRLVVLASGNGSNFQAIVDAGLDVVGLVCNRPEAFVIERAAAAAVPAVVLVANKGEARSDYDARLADAVAGFAPDVVVLAGWMRLLTMAFLGRFPGRVINLHPALPGEFAGTHSIERALAAGVARTGVMVHYVPDEGMDDGPVIATAEVEILPDDTFDTLSERVHATERALLVSALRSLPNPPDPQNSGFPAGFGPL